jgi:hypothetical protein
LLNQAARAALTSEDVKLDPQDRTIVLPGAIVELAQPNRSLARTVFEAEDDEPRHGENAFTKVMPKIIDGEIYRPCLTH